MRGLEQTAAATPSTWRIPLARPSLPPLGRYTDALQEVWSSAVLSNHGPQARRFEAACRDYGELDHAVATANCDLALTLAVRALDLPPGSRVLVPSFTFGSTLHALLWNGLAPEFVDVNPHTFCLDPDAVARALTPDVGLVVATHAFGGACHAAALEALCEGVGAPLLFDGAQAFATWSGGEHIGRRGTATVFSFSATKAATSAEGGLLATSDPELAERVRLLRAYGRDGGREASIAVGLNAKLSELHAALGTLSLEQMDDDVARRAALAERYEAAFVGLPVAVQARAPDERPSYTFMAVDLGEHREAVQQRLAATGIETRRYFQPLHAMEPFAAITRHALPVTERLGHGIACLPLYPSLGIDAVDEIVAAVRAVIEERS